MFLAFCRNPSQNCGASHAIWDHMVFVTCNTGEWNVPRLNPGQTDLYLINTSWEMEGWVDLPGWLFICHSKIVCLSSSSL